MQHINYCSHAVQLTFNCHKGGGSQGRIQDFKLGVALKKIFWVFRVKNHVFTPKNNIFSNCGGRRENIWGISCEKSRFYAKKIIFSPILGGTRAECAPRWIRPWVVFMAQLFILSYSDAVSFRDIRGHLETITSIVAFFIYALGE